MVAVRVDIDVEQGGTFAIAAEVFESDGVTPRTDLAGWTGVMQIRETRSGTATLLAEADVTINTSTGVVTATIPDDETLTMTWRSGEYDLHITDGTETEPLLWGTARLRRTVAR